FGLGHLYPWAAPHAAGSRLDAKAWWLDTPFFVVRAVLYFAFWIAIATAMRLQWQRHRTNATRLGRPAVRRLAIVGLVAYAVPMTLDGLRAPRADQPGLRRVRVRRGGGRVHRRDARRARGGGRTRRRAGRAPQP